MKAAMFPEKEKENLTYQIGGHDWIMPVRMLACNAYMHSVHSDTVLPS